MKISLNWLKEFVPIELDAEALADRLTMAGLEVDSIAHLHHGLEGIVVAEILEAQPHPDADRLRVCRVAGDKEERNIVCGAPNAIAGLKAPLATLGTTMPNGMKIKPAKLRGVASEGMLCSATELGLGEGASASAGLMPLPVDAPVGQSLIDYFDLEDAVLDIDLTPNRADCLSITGIAREVAALTGMAFEPVAIAAQPATTTQSIAIEVDAAKDCPNYLARIITGVDPTATTPLWISERLRRLGVRPLGPIVDVTNYVLLELGQPMHAFDQEKISKQIVVRRATVGEAITLLDEQTIELDPECLVIADSAGPLALAGIMGGLESAVGDDTKNIVLESAWFHPATIAGRGRRFGLSTESSHRFERGVDPGLQRKAMERATELILSIAGGEAGPILEACSPADLPTAIPVTLELSRLNDLLGSTFTIEEVEQTLSLLGMQTKNLGEGVLEVISPSARRDIASDVDLIEEVARVIGYDRLPSNRPHGTIALHEPKETALSDLRLRHQLAARGFQEVMTWSFIGSKLTNPDGSSLQGLALANPLSQDQALMRPMLLPGLLEVAKNNFRYGQLDQCLFELGHCFEASSEEQRLGLLMTGKHAPEHFDSSAREVDFFDIKGEVEHLFQSLQLGQAEFVADDAHPWLHPAKSASIVIEGKKAGHIGYVHPVIGERYGLKQATVVCELSFEAIAWQAKPSHKAMSKFPASRRDLALVLSEDIQAGDVLKVVTEAAGASLERGIIFDLYQGPGVEKGFKSLGIGLIIRDKSRTLTDQDVDAVANSVLNALVSSFSARLRG